VGPRTGLDGCGKSRPHRDSISYKCTLIILHCRDNTYFKQTRRFGSCFYSNLEVNGYHKIDIFIFSHAFLPEKENRGFLDRHAPPTLQILKTLTDLQETLYEHCVM
jgi:hypothetical protein